MASQGTTLGEARTPGEKRAELDDRLQKSLSEFDRMLLREQEVLDSRRVEMSGGGSGSGGAVGGGASGDRLANEDAEDEALSGEPNEPGEPGAAGRGEAGDGEEDESLASRVPPDVPDGEDDDIVARQLREAAMSEEDPELREKLWQEYRDYKRSGP